jgi:4-hydroxy-tetrahydrodipicolinate reductase
MIRVAVVGASGRSGRFVIEALSEMPDMMLHAAVVSKSSPVLGQSVPGAEARYVSDLDAVHGANVVIEFTRPEVSVAITGVCERHGIPVVVATTGHSAQDARELHQSGSRIPVCIASNTSIGAAVLGVLAERARELLGDSFDVEVLDLHHRMKKDAPSGTARTLVNGLSRPDEVVFGRHGLRKSGEVGVVSLRGGDVAGEHTVYLLGEGERIEITHRVSSRAVFGRGALVLAKVLCGRPPGVYSARDLIGVVR